MQKTFGGREISFDDFDIFKKSVFVEIYALIYLKYVMIDRVYSRIATKNSPFILDFFVSFLLRFQNNQVHVRSPFFYPVAYVCLRTNFKMTPRISLQSWDMLYAKG